MDLEFKPDGLPDYNLRHRHHFDWLSEWEIDQLLEEDAVPEPVMPKLIDATDQNPLFPAPPYDSEASGFVAGSIRILSSSALGDTDGPIYVLVMGVWDAEWIWFIPFSSYSVPATDWELLSGLTPGPLQTLQVWNARSCPDEIMAQSWFVTTCDVLLVNDARALYARMVSGQEAIPESLTERVGTRVLDPNDIRMGYLQAESGRLDYLTGLALQYEAGESAEEPDNLASFVIPFPEKNDPMVLAAATESLDRELEYHSWRIVGTSIYVHLMELLETAGAYTLRIEGDSEGLLEGAKVWDGSEKELAEIRMSQAGSSSHPLIITTDSFAVQLMDGQPIRLEYTDS